MLTTFLVDFEKLFLRIIWSNDMLAATVVAKFLKTSSGLALNQTLACTSQHLTHLNL